MRLIIGGTSQGKLSYVRGECNDLAVYDEDNFRELFSLPPAGNLNGKVIVWNHFHLAMRSMLAKGLSSEEIWGRITKLLEHVPQLVIISDEIGNGIVPLERQERQYREETGRMLCRIAREAEEVDRIFCGIAQQLKRR